MGNDRTYRYMAQAILRPDGDYENISIVEYTLDEVRQMRDWSRICEKNKHRWVPLDQEEAEDEETYLEEFFNL